MRLPSIKFTPWVKWHDPNKIPDIDYPGVYMLAKFTNRVPGGNADPLNRNIIYFGETCCYLQDRLSSFNSSAFFDKSGHCAGFTYIERYGNDKGKNLYVSVLPMKDHLNGLRYIFIKKIERDLIFNFASKNGIENLLNKEEWSKQNPSTTK